MTILETLQSDNINELAKALAIAQGQIENAAKDKDNPFYKSKYADLAGVRDACKDALSKNGLSVVQHGVAIPAGGYALSTTLLHSSGQWMRGFLPLNPVKQDPQGYVAAVTYMRRASLAAITGVATEDDDGNAASDKKPGEEGIGAPGNRRTGNKAIDKWVDAAMADMRNAKTLEDLRKIYRLAHKHATESGCTADQIDLLEQQKNNCKAALSGPDTDLDENFKSSMEKE